ncbi:MAG: ABC transporter ATP-binding protein [Candidatus Methylomirabilales bacterium]
MAHVILRDISKRYGQIVAVDRLNLKIERGECLSLLGPSGCGKTTTLRMLAGFEDLDEGEILVGDRIISSSFKSYYLPPEKRDFGMVFQAFAVWPHLSVFDNVAFPLQIRRLSRSEIQDKTIKALTYTGLLDARGSFPNELSGGQKQRIALARSISFNPTVMLLDEPLSNLDPKMREVMRFEIKELQKRFNFTIIYVTHDQAEAMALSDRIVVMDFGALIRQDDTPDNVYLKPANKFVFSFIGLSNFLAVEVADGRVYMQGAREAGPVTLAVPSHASGKPPTLACRPAEIEMVPTGGVRGVVTRRVLLGDIIDYRVQVGPIEVRVQRNMRKPVFNEGDRCGLVFSTLHWYDESGARVPTP